MILSDNETNIDMLNNHAIASTIVELITESFCEPISLGIHGDWGAGKSSILEMVESELEDNGRIECIRFNGWKYQGFEDAKIALISSVVSKLIEKRRLSEKCEDAVKKIWKSINWLSVAKGVGSVALTATTGVPPVGLLSSLFNDFRGSLKDEEKVKSGIEKLGAYLESTHIFDDISMSKELIEFQDSFEQLIEASSIDKLVILIDDLDRCLPEITIETLEAVRLLMFAKSTAFVIAADEIMIEYAVNRHFPDVIDSLDKNLGKEFSSKYLEKLIQVPFRIPALGTIESSMYISLLMIGSKIDVNSEEYKKLLSASMKKMQKPWKNDGMSISFISEHLAECSDVAKNEILISEQISPILSRNSDGNPRKIKRFINMLLLRYKVSMARGFGKELKLTILAKMMLIEAFYFEFYREIATTLDNDGCSSLIYLLEKKFLDEQSSKMDGEMENDNTSDNQEIVVEQIIQDAYKRWNSNTRIMEWIGSDPSLTKIDLRPYYFACKEKYDFFKNNIGSDGLKEIVAILMGSEMLIASSKERIKDINDEDAKQILDIISSKIITQDEFDKKPKGIDGLTELVNVHPELQLDLMTFIETLKIERLGAWVCSGWDKCLNSGEAKKRLDNFKKELADKGSIVVKGIMKTTGGGIR